MKMLAKDEYDAMIRKKECAQIRRIVKQLVEHKMPDAVAPRGMNLELAYA